MNRVHLIVGYTAYICLVQKAFLYLGFSLDDLFMCLNKKTFISVIQSYKVIHYDEKVADGFYDVYANNSDSVAPGKMPMLVDLESVPITEKVDYEVILVNRTSDMELRKLEEKVHLISTECRASTKGPRMSFLVQKIADIVVDTMGGPVNDADEIMRKWEVRSYELRISLNTIILPLGCLDVGLSRHRALLFKVVKYHHLPLHLVI